MAYFDKKVALVTGGANGIGSIIVQNLLENGIKGVGVVDISLEYVNELKEKLQTKYPDKVLFIQADVSKKQDLEDAFEKILCTFKSLDIVINNAGIANELQWEKTVAVNLEAVIRSTYLAKDVYFPKNVSGEEGIIINTASILGLFGYHDFPAYCATKHGVIGLGRALADQQYSGPLKIKIITVCPGPVDTQLINKSLIELASDSTSREVFGLSEKIMSPDFVGKSIVKLIKDGTHGSFWIIDNEEPPYEIKFPCKSEFRK